jgi:hypothetical protein
MISKPVAISSYLLAMLATLSSLHRIAMSSTVYVDLPRGPGKASKWEQHDFKSESIKKIVRCQVQMLVWWRWFQGT